ncbi:hypothetical protein COPEUT_02871 [Coprococcus eutactus ATCC 27759]|nr:hypothetical protein COPEUT_02871 [Coprococcus eutactus ATCC 27759]
MRHVCTFADYVYFQIMYIRRDNRHHHCVHLRGLVVPVVIHIACVILRR